MDFTKALFLPLLGGYLFFTSFNGTRYLASAFAVQRLIFPSAAFGLIFLAAARALELVVEHAELNPSPWVAFAIEQSLPGAALCSLASIAYVAYRYQRPTASGHVGPKMQRKLRRKHRKTIVRCVLLGLIALASLITCMSLTDRTLERLLASAWPMAAFFSASIAVLTRHLTRLTLWPVRGLILRLAMVVLLLAAAFTVLMYFPDTVPSVWQTFVDPVSRPILQDLGTPTLALLVSVAACALGNLVLTRLAGTAYQASSEHSNLLQQLFYQSLVEHVALEITLDSGKVYVGWIVSDPPCVESADGYIKLVPANSGYRHNDTRELVITTRYEQVLRKRVAEAIKQGADAPSFHEFAKVIPIERIVHAGIFDPIAYEMFNPKVLDGSA